MGSFHRLLLSLYTASYKFFNLTLTENLLHFFNFKTKCFFNVIFIPFIQMRMFQKGHLNIYVYVTIYTCAFMVFIAIKVLHLHTFIY